MLVGYRGMRVGAFLASSTAVEKGTGRTEWYMGEVGCV